jgi:multidrug efflux system outer membrane protein
MRAGLLLGLGSLLSACSLAPTYDRPSAPVPVSWPVGDAYLAQREASLPSITYADLFRDARLQSLIRQALDNNRDLQIAAANVEAARAQVRIARSAQLPSVDASGAASIEGRSNAERYAVDAGISGFELDLFGRLRNATAAERARALSTEAAARTVRISLIAELADAWATYAADRDLLAIARDTVANAQRSVVLTRARLEGGIAPRTDLRQAEQILATAQGDVAAQTTALAQDENLIRLLVGAAFDRTLLPGTMAEAGASIAALPAGTSADVLLRRPDVVEAEYLLQAANADIGVARAELFPRISLTGLLGLASDALSTLFTSGSLSATAGAGVAVPLFDAGGRRAGVDVSKARRDAARANYERAIQTAFREVADALATQGTLADRLQAAALNTAAAADTARLVAARYKGGVDSFLANLDAQRALYNARRSENAVLLLAIRNRVDLYRSLGGDSLQAPSR